MPHIFLTGKKQIGKSTIIEAFLNTYQGKVGGFITKRIPIKETDKAQVYIFDIQDKKKNISPENIIGLCSATRIIEAYVDTFDTTGVNALTFEEMPDLIVMDELGIMEQDAAVFKARVLSLLNKDVAMLGVIKDKKTEFLKAVKNHPKTTIITVDNKNKDRILNKIKQLIG